MNVQFRLYTLLVGVVGVGLLAVSALYLTPESLGQHLLRDLGIAAVISSVVTLLIESYSHKRREVDIQTGVLDAILGKVIAPEVWDEIRNSVIGTGVLCDEWQLSLAIRKDRLTSDPAAGSGAGPARDVYVAKGTMTYALRNQLDRTRTVELHHELEADVKGTTSGGRRIPRFVRLDCQAKSTTERYDRKQYEERELRALQEDERTLKVAIKLPPSPSPGVKVTLTREEVMDVPGQLPWYMTWVTLSPRITIDASEAADFDFRFYLRHPNRERLIQRGEGEWEFSGVMLPGQGFAIISTPR